MPALKITLHDADQLLIELTAARAALKRSRGPDARDCPKLDGLMVQMHARLFPTGLAAQAAPPPP